MNLKHGKCPCFKKNNRFSVVKYIVYKNMS